MAFYVPIVDAQFSRQWYFTPSEQVLQYAIYWVSLILHSHVNSYILYGDNDISIPWLKEKIETTGIFQVE